MSTFNLVRYWTLLKQKKATAKTALSYNVTSEPPWTASVMDQSYYSSSKSAYNLVKIKNQSR